MGLGAMRETISQWQTVNPEDERWYDRVAQSHDQRLQWPGQGHLGADHQLQWYGKKKAGEKRV
jgi:hypothetical protein